VVAAIVAGRGKTYESQATLAINQTRAIQVSPDPGVIAKLAALRFKYSGLLTTAALQDPIAKQLALPPADVRGHLTAKVPTTNSLLMQVVGSSPSRTVAQRIAQGAADYLVSYVQQEQAGAHIPSTQRFSFTVVTPAIGAAQTSPTHKLEAGAAGLAAVVGFGISLSVLTLLWRRR